MIKLIGSNSICLIGKLREIELQLASIQNKNMTLAEYLKQQAIIHKSNLN